MRIPAKFIAVCLTIFGLTSSSFGFALWGPEDTFQAVAIGYDIAGFPGPMNLGEGYRYNVPVLLYAYDDTFLNFFGTNGVTQVDGAVQIINSIPTASDIVLGVNGDPNVYINGVAAPTRSKGLNFQAQTLNLLDLKSFSLGLLVNQLGLIGPERWVWCLRARTVLPGGAPTNYTVIQRNFDPISQTYSSSVNGALFTYHIEDTTGQPAGFADAVEDLVDPLATAFTSVASGTQGTFGLLQPGDFYRGLTRDDFAGLRYLMLHRNYHVESLPPTTTLNLLAGSGPWGIPGGTNSLTNIPPVINALRPGIEKVTLQRVEFDSLLGTTFNVTNTWKDTYITNGAPTNQFLQRIMLVPDIVFSASDLGVLFGIPITFTFPGVAAPTYVNEAGINNVLNGPTGGPGVIFFPVQFTFSKLGPSIVNQAPDFLNQLNGFAVSAWGTFDGSATPPYLYPQGASIEALELQVTGGP